MDELTSAENWLEIDEFPLNLVEKMKTFIKNAKSLLPNLRLTL